MNHAPTLFCARELRALGVIAIRTWIPGRAGFPGSPGMTVRDGTRRGLFFADGGPLIRAGIGVAGLHQ